MAEQTEEKKVLPACPVETTLSLIGDKWKVLILRDLLPGTKRFGELKKSIGNVSRLVMTLTSYKSGLTNIGSKGKISLQPSSLLSKITSRNSVHMMCICALCMNILRVAKKRSPSGSSTILLFTKGFRSISVTAITVW